MERAKNYKTYSRRYSHVVTHRSTNRLVRSLSTGERTGSSVFCDLWPYVIGEKLAKYIWLNFKSSFCPIKASSISTLFTHTFFKCVYRAYSEMQLIRSQDMEHRMRVICPYITINCFSILPANQDRSNSSTRTNVYTSKSQHH